MDPHRWQRVDELFQAAIARAADERRDFLTEACAGDDDLRRQIDRLVRAHERSDGFLDTTIIGDALRILASADDASALDCLISTGHGVSRDRSISRCAARWVRAGWESCTKCTTGSAARSSR